jgi:glucosamine-6-phosphate deaminase
MSNERIPVSIYEDSSLASKAVALAIAQLIRQRQAEGKTVVLGLATGHTPINIYRQLIKMHHEAGLDFSNVVSFNLDEYWPIAHDAFQAYHVWMHENFFKHVNIKACNIHMPSGQVAEKDVAASCKAYEQAIADAGGIDLQILGIGRSGHVGFNEPGSARDSKTRRVRLDTLTRKDAAADFFGEDNVPEMAITMGLGTILKARRIALLAFGEHKAPIVRRAVEGEVSINIAASFLQEHPAATMYLDLAAAADLTRVATPWLIGSCQWDDALQRQAVLWLSRKLAKPILKLTDEDYGANGLTELTSACGGAYQLNINIFKHMMNTITGWPGGKKKKYRVLVLSPHPDDDVICMAGTMTRLVEQGHDVHTAYMVSGCLSVFDHDVSRFADFVREFNSIFGLTPKQTAAIEDHIEKFLRQKRPGDVDTTEVRQIKALIRSTEAVAAAKHCGLKGENCHFLDMPFYNTGKVEKLSISDKDVDAVYRTLQKVRPEIIFAAGDMSDPHGTHRLCLDAALSAIHKYNKASGAKCDVWLYRGAWQEWPADQIDMAVPLSPDELQRKRYAIFRHQSQKDRAMFPGAYDSREFWQRAEERNMGTAKLFDQMGLPEYHALEAFARWPVRPSANAAAVLTK